MRLKTWLTHCQTSTERVCIAFVQEAMTNCVRHAQAKSIQICVTADGDQLRLSVSDDGVGLDPAHRRKGLGLRGIDERVKELQGTMTISREPKRFSASSRTTTVR